MCILTQDGMRIVPFIETDMIALEEERKFDYELMKYSEKDTAFYLYLYRSDLDGTKELLGTFETESAARYAISKLFNAINNDWRIVQIPKDNNE